MSRINNEEGQYQICIGQGIATFYYIVQKDTYNIIKQLHHECIPNGIRIDTKLHFYLLARMLLRHKINQSICPYCFVNFESHDCPFMPNNLKKVNIIAVHILFSMFGINDYDMKDDLYNFIMNDENLYYLEIDTMINNVTEYFKLCISEYRNDILFENIKFTETIYLEIKNLIKKKFYSGGVKNLYVIAKMNWIFQRIEKILYFDTVNTIVII